MPRTPTSLLPEFLDSREEPNGPANVAAPEYREVRRSYGNYIVALSMCGDAWGSRDFGRYAAWSFLTFGPVWPMGEPEPRRLS
jgi:hypothetical protein